MSTTLAAPSATEVAKGLSMFEIDESLAALIDAAEDHAEANNGEVLEEIKTALATYIEAFGYKVNRIANYLKAQKAEAEAGPARGGAPAGATQGSGEPREAAEADAGVVHGNPQRPAAARSAEHHHAAMQQRAVASS